MEYLARARRQHHAIGRNVHGRGHRFARVRKPKRRGLVAKGCARRERRQQTRRVVDSRGGGIREREIDERRARRAQPFDGAVQTIGSAITGTREENMGSDPIFTHFVRTTRLR